MKVLAVNTFHAGNQGSEGPFIPKSLRSCDAPLRIPCRADKPFAVAAGSLQIANPRRANNQRMQMRPHLFKYIFRYASIVGCSRMRGKRIVDKTIIFTTSPCLVQDTTTMKYMALNILAGFSGSLFRRLSLCLVAQYSFLPPTLSSALYFFASLSHNNNVKGFEMKGVELFDNLF